MNSLQKHMGKTSFGKIGKACGVTKQAARTWFHLGKLPDTEHLTEKHPRRTHYAVAIAKLVGCKKEELLEL